MDRSENMRRIRSTNTKPEMTVRRLIHRMGYRFRLHRHDFPGRPDLIFPQRKKVVFVHGCFWHVHKNCRLVHAPKTNRGYWGPKLLRTQLRDIRTYAALKKMGWRSFVVWECET